MQDLKRKGLLLRLPGEYNDAFLYGKELYLLSDENLIVINFVKLISDIDINDDQKTLCYYAFTNNDFFYKADNIFYDFFQISKIKEFLLESFHKIQEYLNSEIDFTKYIIAKCPHRHPGAYHLEIYKNTIFISSDNGVFAYKFINNNLLLETNILDFPAYQITATVGNNVYFCCGENKFNIISFDFDNLNELNKGSIKYRKELEIMATGIGFHYTDMLIKDLNDEYHYQYDTLMFDINRQNYSIEKINGAYKEIESNLFKDSKYINFDNNRMLKYGNDNSLRLYKINYTNKKRTDKIEDYIIENLSWKINIPNKIYEGYRTVFGYAVDTDKGTYILDDNDNGNSKPLFYPISAGENVKIRHYPRAINYSHILMNIKNKYIDLYSDLTDYFFPKENKLLRKKKVGIDKSNFKAPIATKRAINQHKPISL